MQVSQAVNVTVNGGSNNDDLFIKIIGIIIQFIVPFIGVITGAAVAYISIYIQQVTIKKKEIILAKTFLYRIKIELKYNLTKIDALYIPLNEPTKDSGERIKLWGWIVSIANSFSFKAYDSFINTGLQRYIKSTLEDKIHDSYFTLEDIYSEAEQFNAEVVFKINAYSKSNPNNPYPYEVEHRNELKNKCTIAKNIINGSIKEIDIYLHIDDK